MTPLDLLAEIDRRRRVIARELRKERDVAAELGRITELRRRLTVSDYWTDLEIAGQIKTIAEWRVWAEELRIAEGLLGPYSAPEDLLELLSGIELGLRISDATVNVEEREAKYSAGAGDAKARAEKNGTGQPG